MKDPENERIEEYRKDFETDMKARARALEIEEELGNLGAEVIEKGARKLLEKQGVDVQKLEQSNADLSKRLAERRDKLVEELAKPAASVAEQRAAYGRMMQVAAVSKHKSGALPSPPLAIFPHVTRDCTGGCSVDLSVDLALGRMYPHLNITGTGWSGKRIGEVNARYLWSFDPEQTGHHYLIPHIALYGLRVMTREHHCYADTDDTGLECKFTIQHSQAGLHRPTVTERTFDIAHGRHDGTMLWPHHECYLRANSRCYVLVTLTFKAWAQSRYARVELNFGSPPADNYVAMPFLSYYEPGDW